MSSVRIMITLGLAGETDVQAVLPAKNIPSKSKFENRFSITQRKGQWVNKSLIKP